jgi:curved DNA binding protein
MEGEGDSEVDKTFVEDASVLDKYKAAGEIADATIKMLTPLLVPGADIFEICKKGDDYIEEEAQKVFNRKKTKKLRRGVAFPTSVSVNHVIGNFSPLKDESAQLQQGDIAKVDLAVHIDGYIAISGHTVFVTADPTAKATGRAADVMLAAHAAKEAALRTILPGNKNSQVTEVVNKAAEEFKCRIVKGVFSHKLKKHVIDGNDVISSSVSDTKTEQYEFHVGDVFGLEIFVSTGSGKPKQSETRTTIFKRAVENTYLLKSDKARSFLKQVNTKYPSLPFSLRAFEDETTARIGVKHCLDHQLLEPFNVVEEDKGELVAHWKADVAVLPNGTAFLSGNLPFDASQCETDNKIEAQELSDLLALSMDLKEQKKRKKAPKPDAKQEPAEESKN